MYSEIENIKISGIANAVPKNSVSNLDYKYISESERKMLIKTIGIKNRRVVNDDTCASDLCEKSANQLIEELGWNKKDIGAVIFVSQSSDYYLPATSIILQDKLALNKSAIAFDVNLGCSGYIYGLHIVSSLMTTGKIEKALLLCGDVSTNSVNYRDKSSYPLFGDSGSATALEYDSSTKNSFKFLLGSDGSGHKSIIIKGGGTRHKFHDQSLQEHQITEGISRHELNIILEGLDIFNFSMREVPKNIKELITMSNFDIEKVDYFVLHQANKIINDSIRKKLKQNSTKFPSSLEEFGNTSSGSIPLTIQHQLKETLPSSNKQMLLSGFGVGLSWGSVLLEMDKVVIPNLIEI